jgi:hypothetical protein
MVPIETVGQTSVQEPVLRRWNRFQQLLNNTTIETYFGIIPQKNDKISFTMEKDPNDMFCILTAKYTTQNTPKKVFVFTKLPQEICKLISEYTCNINTIELKFKITFCNMYPFEAPVWSLIEEKNDMTHLPKGFVLKEYYQDLAERHNSHYNTWGFNWSPSITICTDVLLFIERLHHFDFISQYSE